MTKRDKRMGLPGVQERRAAGVVKRQPRKKKKGSWGIVHVPRINPWWFRCCWTKWYASERARDQALVALRSKTYYGQNVSIYEPVER